MFDEIKETLLGWLRWFRNLPVFVKAFFWLFLLVSVCSYICDVSALMYGEAWLATELPADAKGTRGMYWWGMQGGDWVQISFRITPEKLDEFIEQSCIEPLQENYNPFAGSNRDFITDRGHIWIFIFGKWEPLRLTKFAGSTGTCYEDSNFRHGYKMVVDQANPEIYTVYLQINGRPRDF
jgi:hypothetical protein